MIELTEREKALVNQIYQNMVGRGIITGDPQDEGIEKSELNILAYHMKIIVYEDIKDMFQRMSEGKLPMKPHTNQGV